MTLKRTPLLGWAARIAFGAVVLSLFSLPVFSQESMRDLQQVVNLMYRDASAATDENFVKFNRFFTEFYFPEFAKEANVAQLPALRNRFFVEQVMRVKQEQVHERLVQLTLTEMKKIVENNQLSAAVRCNAMLIIGELNEQERAMRSAPIPMLAGLSYMIEQFKAPNQIDAVRVAAMTGILRHVQMEKLRSTVPIPDTLKGDIINSMLPVAQAAAPPPGRSADGHAWMRRRALEVLGELGAANRPQTAPLYIQIIADSNAPLYLRCAAADVLGRSAVTSASQLKPDQAAAALAKLTVDIYNAESQRVADYQQQGVGPAKPADTRRRFKERFGVVYNALGGPENKTGIAAIVAGNPAAAKVQTDVKQLYTTVDEDTTSSADQMLTKLQAPINKLAGSIPAGAAGPATPDTPDTPAPDAPPADDVPADLP